MNKAAWIALMLKLGPLVLQAIPQTAPIADEIVELIVDAEKLFVHSAQKKTAVMSGTEVVINAYNDAHPVFPLPKHDALTAVGKAIDHLVGLVNAGRDHPHTAIAGA